MELRESFEIADDDGNDGLDEDEFINHFGDVIGQGMTKKQLRHLFMKIDADAGASVDWNEFMNYMLLENKTLQKMESEQFDYINPQKKDPATTKENLCHSKNITCICILYPEMMEDIPFGAKS
jgi:hypothetical protein